VSATATTHDAGAPALTVNSYRLAPRSPFATAWRYAFGVGLLGLGISAYGFAADRDRFAFAYLFGYLVALSLALGSLFFILVLYVTKAGWGISVRRIAELFIRPMPVFAVLLIPLFFNLNHLFAWAGAKNETTTSTSAESAGESSESPLADERGIAAREPAAMRDIPVANAGAMDKAVERSEGAIVDHKRAWLNTYFVLGRAILYLLVWSWLAWRYFAWSTEQDETKAVANTAAAQNFAPLALVLFGFTLTFFAFDWLLSLDATWYSTIFGVYIFAGSALFQMAVLILAALWLRRSGAIGNAVNVEHFHDMGKLLFGWIVFWSYIAFAQFFLQWYSNIPDEVAWYHKRWDENGGAWMGLSLGLAALHFFVPFWFLMSRSIKRKLGLLAIGAGFMVVMHVLDLYWIIMPNAGPFAPNLLDFGCLFCVVGLYLAAVLYGITEYPLVPVGDPRLSRALDFENA
jgi:hypothetical protein